MPQNRFPLRDLVLGMCTEGRSIRQENLAQRARIAPVVLVFARKKPTPKLLTSVAGTTLTSCPASLQHPQRGMPLQLSPRSPATAAVAARTPATSACRRTPRRATVHPAADAHLDFLPPKSIAQWPRLFLLLAPRARKSLSDGNPSAVRESRHSSSPGRDAARQRSSRQLRARLLQSRRGTHWIDVPRCFDNSPWKARETT